MPQSTKPRARRRGHQVAAPARPPQVQQQEMGVSIVEHGVQLSDSDRSLIERRARRLAKFGDRIVETRVIVNVRRRPQREIADYRVLIHLVVPRGELTVERQTNTNLLTSVQEAFRAARRLLQDHVRRLRSPAALGREAALGV